VNVRRCSRRAPVIIVKLQWTLNFREGFLGKYSNVEYRVNPLRWSRIVPCGRADRHNETVTFRGFSNAPNYLDIRTLQKST
jgi:hypothetical protein